MAGQQHWVLPVETEAPLHDMLVDPAQVAGAVRQQLGRPQPPELHPYYAYDLAQLMRKA